MMMKECLLFHLALLLSFIPLWAAEGGNAAKTMAVAVRDFGAVPNDGRDDAAGIKTAIEHALTHGLRSVSLAAAAGMSPTGMSGWPRKATGSPAAAGMDSRSIGPAERS